MRVPGPRANHVDFYINGDYFGLYINVEDIDENLLKSRFGNSNGNLYKCLWPADLSYLGSNPDDYKLVVGDRRVYDLQTNKDEDDYSDLAAFISMLQNTSNADFPVELERQFNINSFLRAYAVDVATGNWDNYAYNQNNYYLYHNPETGKFEFIPYDTDNTYGIDWVGEDWGTRDIYSWYNSGFNLPLIQRIWEVPEYVSRFTFFTEQVQAGLFDEANVFPVIDDILLKIKASAQADVYRTLDYGWDYNDFLDSYTQALGGQVDYGLKPYISIRHDQTEAQLQSTDVIPVISNVIHLPKTVLPGDSVFISAWVEDDGTPSSVTLHYKSNNGPLSTVAMLDDGNHHDEIAGDNIYGATIPPSNVFDTIFFFITATDMSAQTGREPREDDYAVAVLPLPNLVFNEMMASNTNAVPDEFGEYDDWLEIYNADTFSVFLGDKYLSDESGNPDKWRLPDVTLPSHGFVLIWCDEETFQGDYHASFKLSAAGEEVTLYEGTGLQFILLDSLAFAQQTEDVSIGCLPDGILPIISLVVPTPGYSNLDTGINGTGNDLLSVTAFPNPFQDVLQVEINVSEGASFRIEALNLLGERIYDNEMEDLLPGKYNLNLPATGFSTGMYLLRVSGTNDQIPFSVTQKLVKN